MKTEETAKSVNMKQILVFELNKVAAYLITIILLTFQVFRKKTNIHNFRFKIEYYLKNYSTDSFEKFYSFCVKNINTLYIKGINFIKISSADFN